MPVRSKKQKRLFIIFSSILFLIVAFFLFLNYWANYRLPAILGEHVESKHIDINILGSSMKFDHPSVTIDSSANAPGLMLKAAAKSITIHRFSIWDLLFSSQIDVEDFIIDSLQIDLSIPERNPSDSEQKELNVFVKDVFNQIRVNHFEVIKSNFLVTRTENTDTLYQVDGFNLIAKKIVVDTATTGNPFPLEFEQSQVSTESAFLKIGEDYTLTIENLLIKDTTFSIDNLRLSAIHSKDEWVKKHPYEKARLDISSSQLQMDALLWDIQQQKLKITSSKALFDQLEIRVFKDKSPPQEPPQIKPLLSTLIQDLPIVLAIDTVVLKDSYIAYEQRPVQYPRTGLITFENLYMTGYNLTNDTARIREHPVTTLDVLCRFMGEGELQTTIHLPMQHQDGSFRVSGRLGAMPVTYVNQVLVPLGGAEAEGQVHELTFEFAGDNFHSEGNLLVYYDDLKITFVDDERDKQWLKSLLGNIALRKKNTREQEAEDDGFETGEIYFVRYQNKDFWNYLWNSVRTGLMDVVVPFYSHPDKDIEQSDPPKYKEDT